jgi:predicted permease
MDDLQHAWRRLRARPGSAALTVALLALGIGLATAAFTVVDALLIRPLPFPHANRLITLDDALLTNGVAPPVAEWRRHPMFEAVERAEHTTGELIGPARVRELGMARVTPGLFDMLDARPIRGRVFEPGEGRPGADDRIMLSEGVWRSAFGADPNLIGSRVSLDGREMLVVGIMPAEFRFPSWNTVAWVPIEDGTPFPQGYGGGMTYARVVDDRPIPNRLEDHLGGRLVMASPVLSRFDDFTRRAFWGLAGGAGLIFLILCANVAGLFLAQLTSRRRDLGVCTALGASAGRLMRQAFVEQAVPGVAAMAAGIGVGVMLVSFASSQIPGGRSLNPMNVDTRALAVTTGLGLFVMLACAVLPAWIGARRDPRRSLVGASRASTETRGARVATRALLVGQIAVACALLTASTLLVRSFAEMTGTDRGIDVEGVLAVPFSLSAVDSASRNIVAGSIERAIQALPGVEDAVVSGRLPIMLSIYGTAGPLTPDHPGAEPMDVEAEAIQARAGFFRLYRIPVVRGRVFEPGDAATDVVIGERLASILWPGQDPIDRSFRARETSYRVIGVAREVTVPSLDDERDRPEFYVSEGRTTTSLMVSLRCTGGCPSDALLADRMRQVHIGVRPSRAAWVADEFDAELSGPRAIAQTAAWFGAVAIAAVAGGLFAVLSYSVRRRRRDYGIRTALGASPRQLGWTVAREGLLVSATGVVAGAGFAWVLARWLSALQYGVTPLDPITWVTVPVLIGATALAASWLPAREAGRADPLELLRSE